MISEAGIIFMKLIHTADLHLDSRMTGNLTEEQAEVRRQELLHTWMSLMEYAGKYKVRAVLIAGDMFDSAAVSRTTMQTVLDSIRHHPYIAFFYLRGNHDEDSFLNLLEERPRNLFTFDRNWKKYRLSDRIVIAGRELPEEMPEPLADGLVLRKPDCNIVMLHGEVTEYHAGSGAGAQVKNVSAPRISLTDLRNRNIDYLALGHIHQPCEGQLDGRGTWCYAGCLEGRGFDECGSRSFVLLDVNEISGVMSRQRVDIASRHYWSLNVSVTGDETSEAMAGSIRTALMRPEYQERDLYQITLTGELEMDADKNMTYLRTAFEGRGFFVRIMDETRLSLHPERFQNDKSLKGEFVRSVMGDSRLPDDAKAEVIEMGIRLLRGESL